VGIILFPIIIALTVLEAYEVNVRFVENPLIGAPEISGASPVRLEESKRNPTELQGFFPKTEGEPMPKEFAADRNANDTSEALRPGPGTQFSVECCIYSANITVSPKEDLHGLEHAFKKLPENFSFQLVFVCISVSNVVSCINVNK